MIRVDARFAEPAQAEECGTRHVRASIDAQPERRSTVRSRMPTARRAFGKLSRLPGRRAG